ncbi:hypothetical protein DFH07DRAFT_15795 [Mycena maculata]|uniref:Extracellular serine-rich protein n=1 Tax=Mycena maculata TaxID=230809 RepID=A0AAD7N431_9AGAR|nr:hypothetical protein DFH07DRAFT_15795 [Mycena maculata]
MSGVFIVDVGGDPTGPSGLTFSPNTINATSGSTITFRFSGSPGNHSVTQSSYDDPCTPLPGGLDSGFQPVAAGTTSGFFQWSFVVEHEEPLWFFCRQSAPIDHCTAGMVFGLNPAAGTGIESFYNFHDFQLGAEEEGGLTTTFTHIFTDGQTVTTGVFTDIITKSSIPPTAIPLTTFRLDNGLTTTAFSTLVQTTAPPTATGNVKAVQISAIDGVTTVFGFEDADLSSSATSVTPTTITSQSGSAAVSPSRKHVPVAAIVGSTFAVLILISLCVAALFIHRQRLRRAHQGRIRELGRRTESGIIHMDHSEEDLSARPDPLVLYPEKSLPEDSGSDSGSSSSSSSVSQALAEEVQVLRTQIQRLELERQTLGVGASDDLPPPEYASG